VEASLGIGKMMDEEEDDGESSSSPMAVARKRLKVSFYGEKM